MTSYALITTLVGAVVLAFLFGLVAQRLKLPPIIGYLFAGIAIGPYTPGFVGDAAIAPPQRRDTSPSASSRRRSCTNRRLFVRRSRG